VATPEKDSASRRGIDLWSLAARTVSALIVAGALGLLTYETLHHVIAVEPILSSKATEELGLTPQVAAQHVSDQLAAIAYGADSVSRPNLSLGFDKPDVTLPGVGVSVETIASYLRGILHMDTVRTVTGDFTQAHGRVRLRMRVDDVLIYATGADGVDPADAGQELDRAAGMVANVITPYLYAAYLHRIHDPTEADALRAIIATQSADDVALGDTQRLWGQIMAEKGDAAAAQAHYLAARLRYERADDTRRMAELQNYVGQAYLQAGNIAHARAAYRQALGLAPSSPSAATAWLNLGDVLRDHDNDLPAALAAYRSALAINPRMRFAHDAEGRVLEGLSRYKEAAESYRASIGDYPGDAQSYVHLAQIIAERDDVFLDPKQQLHQVSEMATVATATYTDPP
jgi:lipoprotein NlpI